MTHECTQVFYQLFVLDLDLLDHHDLLLLGTLLPNRRSRLGAPAEADAGQHGLRVEQRGVGVHGGPGAGGAADGPIRRPNPEAPSRLRGAGGVGVDTWKIL